MNTNNFRKSLNGFCQLNTTNQQHIANNGSGKHLDIHLYGVIGTASLNERTVLQAIESASKPDTIRVHINTIGGSFNAGLAIYNTLKQHKAHVTCVNMGYCLSMGSLILMAGDEVEAAENSLLMIHRSQGLSAGDVDEHAKAINTQHQHDQALLSTYSHRMGKSDSEIMQLLKAETWYTAAEAKTAGLIDTISGTASLDQSSAEAGAADLFIGKFRNPPAAFHTSAPIY